MKFGNDRSIPIVLVCIVYACTHTPGGFIHYVSVHQGRRVCIYSLTGLIFAANRSLAETRLTLFVIEINRHVLFTNHTPVCAYQSCYKPLLKIHIFKGCFRAIITRFVVKPIVDQNRFETQSLIPTYFKSVNSPAIYS